MAREQKRDANDRESREGVGCAFVTEKEDNKGGGAGDLIVMWFGIRALPVVATGHHILVAHQCRLPTGVSRECALHRRHRSL